MLQGTVTKAEKDGSAFTLLADDGNEYTMLFLISAMSETEIEKNIQIAIACMKDASGDPEKQLISSLSRNRKNGPFPLTKASPPATP